MRRTVASFALATLSLLVAYVIDAAWPDAATAPASAAAPPASPAAQVTPLAQ
jgi:hypothetical protein